MVKVGFIASPLWIAARASSSRSSIGQTDGPADVAPACRDTQDADAIAVQAAIKIIVESTHGHQAIPICAFANLDTRPARAHMQTMFHRLRSLPVVLPWLAGVVLFFGTEASAAQQSSQTRAVETDISSARSARVVSVCRNEAERQAAPEKGLHSVQLDKTAHPEVMRSQSGTRDITHMSLAGWARSGNDWVPITAQCEFDKGRPAVVSLDLALSAAGLDLSGIGKLPEAPARPEATFPSFSRSPPRTDPSEASGSSTIVPTLRETDLPPYLNKGQDFLHDHQFGIELRKPF